MTVDEILAEVEDADDWKARVVCASAAERAAPLFRTLGRDDSIPVFESGLDALWAAVESGRVGRVRSALTRLPEADEDDSNSPAYFAGLALVVLLLAIEHASTSDPQKALNCIEELLALCDGIDTTLIAAPRQTFRYDPKNPPPPGEIETREINAQIEVLERLRSEDRPTTSLTDALRKRAREHASAYEAVAPRLAST